MAAITHCERGVTEVSQQVESAAVHRATIANARIRDLEDELRAERERRGLAVVQAVDEGVSYRTLARRMKCAYATVYKIVTDWA